MFSIYKCDTNKDLLKLGEEKGSRLDKDLALAAYPPYLGNPGFLIRNYRHVLYLNY